MHIYAPIGIRNLNPENQNCQIYPTKRN
jgi:hypothetical protein